MKLILGITLFVVAWSAMLYMTLGASAATNSNICWPGFGGCEVAR
jgi:hypothetical protein